MTAADASAASDLAVNFNNETYARKARLASPPPPALGSANHSEGR